MSRSVLPLIRASKRRSSRSAVARARRFQTLAGLERLEDRRVLSTFDVSATGVVTYTESSSSNNNVIEQTDGTTNIFSDSGDTISLTGPGSGAFTVDLSHHTVTGPESQISSMVFNTGSGTDTFHIQSILKPLSINGTGNQSVFIGHNGTGGTGAQEIKGAISIANPSHTTDLTIDDRENIAGQEVTIGGGAVNGLAPSPINVAANALSSLTIHGGSGGNYFSVAGSLAPTTTLDTGTGLDSTFIDSVAATTTLNVQNPNGADTINVGHGAITNILGTVNVTSPVTRSTLTIDDTNDSTGRTFQISGTATTGFNATGVINYTPTDIGNFSVLGSNLDGGTANNTFTITGTIPGQTNKFATGTGIDTVKVQGTSLGSTVNIDGMAGADTVTIGDKNQYTATNILSSSINITNGSSLTTLVVDDSSDSAARSINVGTSQLTGLTPNGPINYNPGHLKSLKVKGGDGGNTFTMSNTGNNTYPTSLTSGAGDDTFKFLNNATLGGGAIDGGGGSNTLDYSAYTTSVFADLHSTGQPATGTGASNVYTNANLQNVIAGSGGSILTAPANATSTLTGGSGVDTFNIPADAGNVTVIGTGNDPLNINGPDTGDTFNVSGVGTGSGVDTTVVGTATPHTVTSSGINTLNLVGGLKNTTATIDFGQGNPLPSNGLNYDGGQGYNDLRLINGSFGSEYYSPEGNGRNGQYSFYTNLGVYSSLSFTNAYHVYDSVTVGGYQITVPSVLTNIGVGSVSSVNGVANGTTIANVDPYNNFAPTDLANKSYVGIIATSNLDTTVTVNDPTQGAGLSNLSISTGNGNDYINLLTTPAGVNVNANSGSGTDTFNVNAASMGGSVSLDSSTATGTLIYDAGNLITGATPNSLVSGTKQGVYFQNMTTAYVNNILDLPLAYNSVSQLPIQEGQLFSGKVGSFRQTGASDVANQLNPIAKASDFVATIDWGDGSTSAGTIVPNNNGFFDVVGNHSYKIGGSPSIQVSVVHRASQSSFTLNGQTANLQTNGGSTTTILSSASVSDAPLTIAPAQILATEGAALPSSLFLGSFVDANPLSSPASFTAMINWNDGSGSHPVMIAPVGSPGTYNLILVNSPFTFSKPGNANATLAVFDGQGTIEGANVPVIVADAALSAIGTNISGVEGNRFTGQVATFNDANPVAPLSDFTAAINWGDGIVSSGSVSQPGGVGTAFVVTGTHNYKFGSFPITVSIADKGGSTVTATAIGTGTSAPLTSGPATTLTGTEGQAFTGYVGTFTSTNPLATAADFTASVDWTDGTPISIATIAQAPNGTFYVTASHTYAEESATGTPYAPVVTVKSVSGAFTAPIISPSVTINDTSLYATSLPVTSVEANPTNLAVAAFTDTNPNGVVGDDNVVINWGDGTTSTGSSVTITPTGTSPQGATFAIAATHAYSEPGNYVIKTTISDVGGSSVSTLSPSIVSDAALVANVVPVSGVERGPLVNVPVATFVDLGGPDALGEYTATIDWGDGKPQTMGLISLASNDTTFLVSGSHTYDETGSYAVHVSIQAADGARTTIRSASTIADAPIIITGDLDASSDSGVSNSDKITNVTQPVFNGTSEPGSIINLYSQQAGAPTLIGTAQTSPSGLWSIRTTYLPDGVHNIFATATDPEVSSEVTAPVYLLGASTGKAPLVIDTTGPVVTETILQRPLGQIIIAFQDFGGGLTQANIRDGTNFNFHAYGKMSFPPNLITSINVIGSGTPNDPIEAILTINNGRPLKSGSYVLTVKSGGVTDTAGNALDGEYYGYLPTGNHKAGGDFQTLLVSNKSYTFAPLPTNSTATPVTPPGLVPPGYHTPKHPVHAPQPRPTVRIVNNKGVMVKKAAMLAVPTASPANLTAHDLAIASVKVKKHR